MNESIKGCINNLEDIFLIMETIKFQQQSEDI